MADSKIYEGKLFRIKVAGKTIFHETKFSLSSSLDFKEIASKDTSGKLKTPGAISWSISCDTLGATSGTSTQEDIKTLYAKHVGKEKVTLDFSTHVTGDVVFSGEAYVGSYSLDSSNDEEVTGSFTFEGTGDLSMGNVA